MVDSHVNLGGLISQAQLLTQLTSTMITLSMRFNKTQAERLRPLIDSTRLLQEQHQKLLEEKQVLGYLQYHISEKDLNSDDLAVVRGLKQLCKDADDLLLSPDPETEKIETFLKTLEIILPTQ